MCAEHMELGIMGTKKEKTPKTLNVKSGILDTNRHTDKYPVSIKTRQISSGEYTFPWPPQKPGGCEYTCVVFDIRRIEYYPAAYLFPMVILSVISLPVTVAV